MKLERKADDNKTGMTIAELYQFLQDTDKLGIDPRSTITVRVGFSAQVKSIACGDKKEA